MDRKRLNFLILMAIFFFIQSVSAASIASFFFDTSMTTDATSTLTEVMRSNAVIMQINTNSATTCKYGVNRGTSYDNMEGNFDLSFDTLHKKTLTDLNDGVYKFYVRCKTGSNETRELEVKFSVSVPVSAKILIEEEVLKAGRAEIKMTTSKLVSQAPVLTYSFDGIGYDPIPLTGSGVTWTGYLIISKDAGEKVGSFKFQGRDLEGNLGSEITSGNVFFVDALKPKTIGDFDAVGLSSKIELEWSFEEDIANFRIYRATEPNVEHSDFYKEVGDVSSYTDSSVEKGKTYYYKISAVDEAGNEGDLSFEAYATALNDEISKETNTGLELRYHGLVDSFVTEINLALDSSNNAKSLLENRGGKETEIYKSLRLSREIDGANAELNSLKREVENYKLQSLTKNDLDNKLNSARLKLVTIKKKVPESIIVSSEKVLTQEVSEQDIRLILLELNQENSDFVDEIAKRSFEVMTEKKFRSKTSAYNLEIVYLDGTRKKTALIREDIDFDGDENSRIVEYIPKDIAESVSQIDIKNVDYEVLKDDPIVEFSQDTREISYSLDSVNFNDLKKIKTVLVYELPQEDVKKSSASGYFAFMNFESVKDYSGILLGFIAIGCLFVYLIFTRKDFQSSEKIAHLRRLVTDARRKISEGRKDDAKDIYNTLAMEYKTLGKKEKKAFFPELNELYKKMGAI